MEFYFNIYFLLIFAFILLTCLIALKIKNMLVFNQEKIEFGNGQLIGKQDHQNDYFTTMNNGDAIISIVADGLTSEKVGKYASVVAVESFKNNFKKKTYRKDMMKFFSETYETIDNYLTKNSTVNRLRATIVCMLIRNGIIYWSSVGNCKLYMYRNGDLITVNDINLEKEQHGKIISKKAIFILCTEGAYDTLSEKDIITTLKEKMHPHDKTLDLIKKIKEYNVSYQKNATIIVLEKTSKKIGIRETKR